MKGRLLADCLLSAALSISTLSHADLKQGIAYYNANDFVQAQQALLPDAKAGNAISQFYLALSYIWDPDKKQWNEMSEGKKWLYKSAENGNPYAMWRLGNPHIFGPFFGGVKDQSDWQAKAINRWKQLAKQGNSNAVAMLAEYDAGITQYIPFYGQYKLKKSLSNALDMGSNIAATDYYNYFISQASEKEKKTIGTYLEVAAKRGYMPAMELLAGASSIKKVVGMDKEFFWAKQCAILGSPNCVSDLSYFYMHGQGTPINYFQAYTWMLIGHDYSGEYLLSGDVNKLNQELTTKQKSQAKKEADSFVANHLPNYGKTPLNP